MGIYLSCYVNFTKVSPKKWEKIYLETLDWLYKCPLPLIRKDILVGQFGSRKRIYTKELVRNKDNYQECWSVEGDEESYKTVEGFNLYRNLERVLEGKENSRSKQSIFYAEGEDVALEACKHGINVWSDAEESETEGYPIHLALLAAGIWMEYRLPGVCFIQGRLSKDLAERVLDWMRGYSNEPLEMPVVLNEERLWEYTKAAFDDQKVAMRRFFGLYKGDNIDGYAFFFESGYKKALMEMLAEDLADYASLGALGSLKIIRQFLRACDDVDLLIDLVEMANEVKVKENAEREKTKENAELEKAKENDEERKEEDNPLFKLKDLLKELCKEMVMVNPGLKECINVVDGFSKELMTISLMLTGLRRYDPRIYVAEEELFEVFMCRAPKRAKRFKKIIDKGVSKHAKLLKKYKKKTDGLTNSYEKLLAEKKKEAGISFEEEEQKAIEAGIFMATAWVKKKKYLDEELMFLDMGDYLRKVYPKFAPTLWGGAGRIKWKLFNAAYDIDLYFHEDALEELKRLKDVKLLQLMCMLTYFNEGFGGGDKENFKHWFIHFFRHPKFWPLLLGDE